MHAPHGEWKNPVISQGHTLMGYHEGKNKARTITFGEHVPSRVGAKYTCILKTH